MIDVNKAEELEKYFNTETLCYAAINALKAECVKCIDKIGDEKCSNADRNKSIVQLLGMYTEVYVSAQPVIKSIEDISVTFCDVFSD